MFGQHFPRPIPKKPNSQNPEFNSIPIPPPIWGGNRIPPPKQWIPPPEWRGNPSFWGGNRYRVEFWILRFGFFRDRSRKILTKHFRHLKSFKKRVFEISIFEIVFFSASPNVPGAEWSYSPSKLISPYKHIRGSVCLCSFAQVTRQRPATFDRSRSTRESL